MNADKVVEMLYSEMVYYVVQYNYVGKFDIAPCSKHIEPNLDEGNDGSWMIASGPYDSVRLAGKALALAYESYDLGSYNTWNEAQSDLINVINESCIKGTSSINHYKLLEGLDKLINDWGTD